MCLEPDSTPNFDWVRDYRESSIEELMDVLNGEGEYVIDSIANHIRTERKKKRIAKAEQKVRAAEKGRNRQIEKELQYQKEVEACRAAREALRNRKLKKPGSTENWLTERQYHDIVAAFANSGVHVKCAMREFIEGVLWIMRTDNSWRFLPARFGNCSTVQGRFEQWKDKDRWITIMGVLLKDQDFIDNAPDVMVKNIITKMFSSLLFPKFGIE